MLSRKHFEATAAIICNIKDDADRKLIAVRTAKAYEKENPRFDRRTFLKACNVKV